MLLLDRGRPRRADGEISPWLDMLIRTDDEVFGLLDGQSHRRFMKTHTPLDGIPRHPSVTYIAVIRHPLDVALSDADHFRNQARRAARRAPRRRRGPRRRRSPPARGAAGGRRGVPPMVHRQPRARQPVAGPHGLEDYCDQARTYWVGPARSRTCTCSTTPTCGLDLRCERCVARGRPRRRGRRGTVARVRGGGGHRRDARACRGTEPEAHLGIWTSPERFFRSGGTRDWASLLDASDLERFEERLRTLAGDAVEWVLRGRGGARRGLGSADELDEAVGRASVLHGRGPRSHIGHATAPDRLGC